MRLTIAEHRRLKKFAADHGLTAAEYVRDQSLLLPVVGRVDKSALELLNKLYGLLTEMWEEPDGPDPKLLAGTIKEIHEAVRLISKGAQDAPNR